MHDPVRNTHAAYDWDHLVRPDRIHTSLYTDPAFFKLEMTRLFGGVWTFLCHDSELPARNSFKRVRLGQRSIVVTRDAAGTVHALLNRCPHRGATVCQEESGVAARFTCMYHGWTFKNDGQLQGVAYPEGYGENFDRSELALKRIPRVETYRGFIFGTYNDRMPSLAEYLGETTKIIDYFLDRSPVGEIELRSGAFRGTFRGNWKLAFDNAADGYHPNFSHRSIRDMTRARNGQGAGGLFGKADVGIDGTGAYALTYPNGHGLLYQRAGMGPSLWQRLRPTPGGEAQVASLVEKVGHNAAFEFLEGAPGSGVNLNIFPNLLIVGNQVQVIEPLAHDLTQLNWYATRLKGMPDEINTLRMRVGEDFPVFGETDDLEIFERCFEGMQAPESEWVLCNRGLHRPDADVLDEATGIRKVLPTDEAPMRNFYAHYRAVMERDVQDAA